MPLKEGRSSPSAKPKSIPHTGEVVNTSPVLAALVRLTPKVKAVWAAPTPKHPTPSEAERHDQELGKNPAAYFVAAKFSPQKTAARIKETSVSTAVLSFIPLTAPDSIRKDHGDTALPDSIPPP